MMPTVQDVYELVNDMAPFDTQEEWDNAGLLAGSKNAEVTKVLCALDLTEGAIEEARFHGCELIVTHHPVLFHARSNITEDDPEGKVLCALIRARIALIAAHTNFDVAPGGVNDCLAQAMMLRDVSTLDGGLRIGTFSGGLQLLMNQAKIALGGIDRVYGKSFESELRVAVCGGAGSGIWKTASDAGASVYVTGEVKHSDALAAVSAGLVLLECGHDRTERISVKALKSGLQRRLDALQYKITVYESTYEPY